MRPFSKQLICPECGDVIGQATLRPLTGWLTITEPGGGLIGASKGAVQLRLAQQRLDAATDGERARAQRQLEFVQRQLGEQIYDLRCPRGHRTFVTSPQIARAMRRAGGAWAEPG
jgi:hypothetical protein